MAKILNQKKFRSNMAHITISIEPQSLQNLNKLSKELKISRGKTIEKLINNFYKFKEYDKKTITKSD